MDAMFGPFLRMMEAQNPTSECYRHESRYANPALDDPTYILVDFWPPEWSDSMAERQAHVERIFGERSGASMCLHKACVGFGRCPHEGCKIPLAPEIGLRQRELGSMQPDGDATGVCPTHGRVTILDYQPCTYRLAILTHGGGGGEVARRAYAPHIEVGSTSDDRGTNSTLPHPVGVLATWRRPVWPVPPPTGTVTLPMWGVAGR